MADTVAKVFLPTLARNIDFATTHSNATSIRCNRDSDSILAAVATSYDFCNSIGTSATWRGARTRSALSPEADMGLKPSHIEDRRRQA
jgi:hypothetical protein